MYASMWAWRILGMFAFALGWIVAAFAFVRSDPRWAAWIYARPGIGPHIQTFVETGRIGMRSKAAALAGMALAAAGTVLLFWNHPWPMAGSLGFLAIGAAFVISRKAPLPAAPQPPQDIQTRKQGE